MFLREWKPALNLKNDILWTLPIWVKLPQLPLHLWGATSLSKISNSLGNPLATDECTTNKFRISYVRILLEVDIAQELAMETTIKDSKVRRMKQLSNTSGNHHILKKAKSRAPMQVKEVETNNQEMDLENYTIRRGKGYS